MITIKHITEQDTKWNLTIEKMFFYVYGQLVKEVHFNIVDWSLEQIYDAHIDSIYNWLLENM